MLTVIYSLALSAFLYRDLTWRRFHDAMIEAGVATGIVMLVIMGSAVVGWIDLRPGAGRGSPSGSRRRSTSRS